MSDRTIKQETLDELIEEVVHLQFIVKSLHASMLSAQARECRWKQIAEAYERGDMGAADELFKNMAHLYG